MTINQENLYDKEAFIENGHKITTESTIKDNDNEEVMSRETDAVIPVEI